MYMDYAGTMQLLLVFSFSSLVVQLIGKYILDVLCSSRRQNRQNLTTSWVAAQGEQVYYHYIQQCIHM